MFEHILEAKRQAEDMQTGMKRRCRYSHARLAWLTQPVVLLAESNGSKLLSKVLQVRAWMHDFAVVLPVFTLLLSYSSTLAGR